MSEQKPVILVAVSKVEARTWELGTKVPQLTPRDVYMWLEKFERFKNWQGYKGVWFLMRPEVSVKMISNGIE